MPSTKPQPQSDRAWQHRCVVCGSTYFGSRCAIFCARCRAKGKGKACGRCYLCETKIPFFPHRLNRGPLFCANCAYERHLETVRERRRRFPSASGIGVTPTYEESDLL